MCRRDFSDVKQLNSCNMFAIHSKTLMTFNKVINHGFVRKIHAAPFLLNEAASEDLYDILRIPKDATQTDIKEAYYKLSKVYHPDVKKDESSHILFRKITEAYDTLGNVRSRQEYDEKMFGKKLKHSLTKDKFYVSLFQDKVYKPFRSPDYEEILRRRPMNDLFLKMETEDRRIEVQTDRQNGYEHRFDLMGEWGSEKLAVYFIFFWGLNYFWKWAEDVFDWGMGDPKLSPILTKPHTQEMIDKARWTL